MRRRQTTGRAAPKRFHGQFARRIAQLLARLGQQQQTDAPVQFDFVVVVERFGNREQPGVTMQQMPRIRLCCRLARGNRLLKLLSGSSVLAALEQQFCQKESGVAMVGLGFHESAQVLARLLVVAVGKRRRRQREVTLAGLLQLFGLRRRMGRDLETQATQANQANQANQATGARDHRSSSTRRNGGSLLVLSPGDLAGLTERIELKDYDGMQTPMSLIEAHRPFASACICEVCADDWV